ncbi:hypothetical protein SO802_006357 [Lithocarpus litseifolius]|uniref:Reverse transcriptase domain-containing protein n=1 Tax=Lithocarpus litseifolius TaxID=425828 RepID=A0AAW2DM95_9ROSI
MHSRKKGKKGSKALKLDISKAYDRVEWHFLHRIMEKLGFPAVWIDRVMSCVTTTSLSILINGKSYGLIHPSRGIRQGDPLSPYLFLLCAEGFTALLKKAESEGRIKGVSICRGAPKVTNLLFADDSLLFCQATRAEGETIAEILQTYERASGQRINLEMSSVYFSSNTSDRQKGQILDVLGVNEVDRFETYLGLPTLIGRAKYHTFSFLKDRIWKKLQGWKGMLLSKAGKEILIKAVAQSMPTYSMSVFQIPKKLCDELDALCAKFWWGQMGNERKIHWKSWDKLTVSKKEGGMGFRDLRAFNLAMLAMQGWRMVKGNDSLLYQCFKARYFPRSNFLEAKESPNCSYVWRSLMAAMPILQSGHCWRVGNGESIHVLKDKWIPYFPTNKVLVPIHGNLGELMSAYHVARRILTEADRVGPSRGCVAKQVWAVIWKLRIPNKIKVFAWRACHEILPTVVNLTRRRVIHEDKCSLCTGEPETTIHALWDCAVAQDIWAGSIRTLQKYKHGQADLVQLMEEFLERMNMEEIELFWTQAWLIWSQRNCLLHGGKLKSSTCLNKRTEECIEDFKKAQNQLIIQSRQQPSGEEWRPPPLEAYKLNFDAALFSDLGRTGYGAIVRNEKGEVMAAMTASGPDVHTSDEAELLACRRAVEFAVEAGFSRLIIEGDNNNAIHAISSSKENTSLYGNVVDDIRHLIRGLLWSDICCVRRGGNRVAHALAQHARHALDEDLYWVEDSPAPALDALYHDSLSI